MSQLEEYHRDFKQREIGFYLSFADNGLIGNTAISSGVLNFKKLCDSGERTLPLFIKIPRTMATSGRDRLLGDLSNNPVYILLDDLAKESWSMAYKRFNATHSRSDYSESWEFDNAREHVISNKQNFFQNLRTYLVSRGEENSAEEDIRINGERYCLLEKLAGFSGQERKRRMRKFVGLAPSRPWEDFDWDEVVKIAK